MRRELKTLVLKRPSRVAFGEAAQPLSHRETSSETTEPYGVQAWRDGARRSEPAHGEPWVREILEVQGSAHLVQPARTISAAYQPQ